LQASLQASASPIAQAPLDATALLSVEELRQITGGLDEVVVERLEDRPRTPRYDSAHFRAQSRGEDLDAAFRVSLYDSAAEAEKDFVAQAAELPSAEPIEEAAAVRVFGPGVRVLRGRERGSESGAEATAIRGLLVLDRGQRATVLVTCGVGLCHGNDAVDAIARKVVARLTRVERPAPVPRPAEPRPQAPKSEPADEGFKLREPELHR